MKNNFKLLQIASLALVSATFPGAQVMAGEHVSQQDMPKYCKGEASAKFHVRPGEIRTLPVERTGDRFKVFGQTPADGENALFFTCAYKSNGKFLHVRKDVDKRSKSIPSNRTSDQVNRKEMPAYCRGMAAEKFHQRPQDITTQEVEHDHGKFMVYGFFPPESNNQTSFSCTFNSNGEFVRVHQE